MLSDTGHFLNLHFFEGNLHHFWENLHQFTQGGGPGAKSTVNPRKSPGWSTLRGPCTQWATTVAPETHCGKECWARQGKEPPTKPGWAERRATVWSQCSVKHPGHRAGAHATRVNHEVHATRNQQGTRPAHARPNEWGSVPGGRPGQHMEEQSTWVSCTRKHSEAGCGRPEDGSVGTAKTVKRPLQQPAQPQYANYWTPLMRKRHILPHPAQPQHTNHWALRTQKQHQQEHQPQRPTESSDPTQRANGRTGDCPGPVKKQQPDGMSHRGALQMGLWRRTRLRTHMGERPHHNIWALYGGG